VETRQGRINKGKKETVIEREPLGSGKVKQREIELSVEIGHVSSPETLPQLRPSSSLSLSLSLSLLYPILCSVLVLLLACCLLKKSAEHRLHKYTLSYVSFSQWTHQHPSPTLGPWAFFFGTHLSAALHCSSHLPSRAPVPPPPSRAPRVLLQRTTNSTRYSARSSKRPVQKVYPKFLTNL